MDTRTVQQERVPPSALYIARVGKRLSLREVADAAEVSLGQVNKIELSKVDTPSPRALRRISKVVGIPFSTAFSDFYPEEAQELGVSFAAPLFPDLKPSEARELRMYLAYIRWRERNR